MGPLLLFDHLPVEALPPMDAPLPGCAHPKVLADHRSSECLWPLGPAEAPGDWRTLFCCAPVAARRRYCPDHARLALRATPEGR
jgi:hypothetical protein